MALEVYDNEVVERNEQAGRFMTTLAKVSIRDYGQDYGLSDKVTALDVDAWETSQSGNNDKTMDAAIGIADYVDNLKRASRFLLVELRMNYTGQGQNSKTPEMKAKSLHTRGMLAGSLVDERSFFIFSKSVAPSVRNRISREAKVDKSLTKWKIVTPEEFANMFQFVEDLPYTPISPIEGIRNEGNEFVAVAEFGSAVKLIQFWLNKVNAFYNQYKHEECKALIGVIQEIVDAMSQRETEITDEDLNLDFQIAKEDIGKYQKLLSLG